LIRAGNRILVLKSTGDLVLFAANPQKYQPLGSLKVATGESGITRALPAFANGKLFFRTTTYQGGELECLELVK